MPDRIRPGRTLVDGITWLAIAGAYAITIVDVRSLERYDATGGGLRSVTLPQAAARVSHGAGEPP